MALPEPLYVLGRVMVPMEACPTDRAGMPADGQAFGDQRATARTSLAGECRTDRHHPPTGACCLESEDAQERRPPCIADALGEMVVSEHIADLQVFMKDHIVGADQCERRLVVKVLPLATHFLMRLGKQ
jgi:hypothetical protein